MVVRLNLKIASPRRATLDILASVVDGRALNDRGAAQTNAFAALIAARGVDVESEKRALASDEMELRRLAVTVLAGGGAGLEEGTRNRAILASLRDLSPVIRSRGHPGVHRQATAANGCDPLINTLKDEAPFVAIAAIDALAASCPTDDAIATRLIAEARPPSPGGPWTREAHAFVALANDRAIRR